MTYALAVGVVERLQLHDVGVSHDPHDLEFAVLEPFVLQDSLDGSVFVGGREFRLENHAERSVANNLTLGILYLSSLASDAILDLFADHFCMARQYDFSLHMHMQHGWRGGRSLTSHPQGIEGCWPVRRHG